MRYEIIQSTFPEELPVGSVVLGKSGKAWQSIEDEPRKKVWWACALREGSIYHGQGYNPWAYLVIEEAPLQVLYRAGENSGE